MTTAIRNQVQWNAVPSDLCQ